MKWQNICFFLFFNFYHLVRVCFFLKKHFFRILVFSTKLVLQLQDNNNEDYRELTSALEEENLALKDKIDMLQRCNS